MRLSCGRHHMTCEQQQQQQNPSCLFVLLEAHSWLGQDPTWNIIFFKSYLKQKYMCNHIVVKLNQKQGINPLVCFNIFSCDHKYFTTNYNKNYMT